MAHQCRRPIANGCVVDSKSTIGLIRGETLWVGASSTVAVIVVGRQHSGVVAVARRSNTGRSHEAISGL